MALRSLALGLWHALGPRAGRMAARASGLGGVGPRPGRGGSGGGAWPSIAGCSGSSARCLPAARAGRDRGRRRISPAHRHGTAPTGGWRTNPQNPHARVVRRRVPITAEVAPGSSPRPSILRSAVIMASGFLVSSTDPASAKNSRERDSAEFDHLRQQPGHHDQGDRDDDDDDRTAAGALALPTTRKRRTTTKRRKTTTNRHWSNSTTDW